MSLIKKIKDKKVNFEFNKEYIKVVTSKISNNDAEFITNSFNEMHPADAADIIEHLNQSDRESLIKLNKFNIDPQVFIELNEAIQSEIIAYLSPESIVRLLKNLESDDAITILENVEEKDKNSILSSLPPKDRFALLESLSYPEDTAARIMQREFTAIPSNWSVGQTIDYLRDNKDLAAVVDKTNKLVGMIMYDDILTVLKEEAEEDALRLAGVGDEEITDGVFKKTRRRFNWLLLNLFTAFLATWVISLFGATIEQMVVLAFLMPIVASMGGNAGMQTLAVTVRTLATNDLTKNNFTQNILKEFNIGILNGIIFAVISALIVQLWFQDNLLSLIISMSMIITMMVAGLFGIVVPITLKKMSIDPAIASSVFVTTITDVIGFVSFLGVSAYFL